MARRSGSAASALGASVHSGWAVIVVAGGSLRQPVFGQRRRIELVTSTDERYTHPYHTAAELPIEDAPAFIDGIASQAKELAVLSLRELSNGVSECGIVVANKETSSNLETTLRSHAMIHAAEGRLFRDAIANAAAELQIHVHRFPEATLVANAARACGAPPEEVEHRIATLRETAGAPWRRDEKLATLAALLALR